jgi:CheY-like chemotaxis protein
MNPTVLLVEDESNDVYLMEDAFRKAGVAVQLQVVRDGREALRYLRGEGPYADRKQHPLPRLTLLDLNLPYVHGLQVLKQIREEPRLRSLIVVVLTSSVADSDIERAYELGANSYLGKPNNLEAVQELVELIGRYWLSRNRLPRVCRRAKRGVRQPSFHTSLVGEHPIASLAFFRFNSFAMENGAARLGSGLVTKGERMKIILRERTTGLWLKPCGRWQATSVNARQFATSEEAVQCSIELHLPNVDVCFVGEDVTTKNAGADPLAAASVSIRAAA